MQVEYRRATEEDLEQVAILYGQWEREGPTRGLIADTSEDLRIRMGPYFLVAYLNDRIIGFSIAREISEDVCVFPAGEGYLVLDDLYVAPGYRGKGIGSALVRAIMEIGRCRGVHRITTYSANKDWQPTLKFYEKFGFEVWSLALFLDCAGAAKDQPLSKGDSR